MRPPVVKDKKLSSKPLKNLFMSKAFPLFGVKQTAMFQFLG